MRRKPEEIWTQWILGEHTVCPLWFKFRRNFHSVVLSQDSRHHLDMCHAYTLLLIHHQYQLCQVLYSVHSSVSQSTLHVTSVGRSQHFIRRQCTNYGISIVYGQLLIYRTDNLQFSTDPCLTIVTSWSQRHFVRVPIKSSEPWQDSERRETLVTDRVRFQKCLLLALS